MRARYASAVGNSVASRQPVRARPLADRILGWAIVVAIFYPRLFAVVGVPEFYGLALILIAAAIIVVGRSRPTVALLSIAALMMFFAVRGIALIVGEARESVTQNLGEVATIAVLALAVGWIGASSGIDYRAFRRPYLIVATITACLAAFETATDTRLFPAEGFVGYLDRSYVGQQHPITLGLMLAAGVALLYGIGWKVRIPMTALLVWGAFATGSEGPIVIAITLAAAVTFPRVTRWFAVRTKLLVTASVAALAVVTYLIFTQWGTRLYDTSVDEYSSGYRSALYAILPDMLARNPLGYGPDGMPPNTYYIESMYRGVRDMSVSIDAEPVYLAAQIGVLGLVLFLVVYFVGVNALKRALVPALMLIALMVGGTLVALHAWLSITALVAGLLGVCVYALRHYPAAAPFRRLRGRQQEPRSSRPASAVGSSNTAPVSSQNR